MVAYISSLNFSFLLRSMQPEEGDGWNSSYNISGNRKFSSTGSTLLVLPGSPFIGHLRASENMVDPKLPGDELWSRNWSCWIWTGGKLQSSQKTATDGGNLFLPYAPLGAKAYDDDDDEGQKVMFISGDWWISIHVYSNLSHSVSSCLK